jgi:hypothetical protein
MFLQTAFAAETHLAERLTWQEQSMFPLASVSRPHLGPNQPPAQWVPGGPFPRAKVRPRRNADHSPI